MGSPSWLLSVLASLIFSSVGGFNILTNHQALGQWTAQCHNKEQRRVHGSVQPKSLFDTDTNLKATSSDDDKENLSPADVINRNMFHNYDKPIILVGCSGGGEELNRLANSFLSEQQKRGIKGSVVRLSSIISNSGEEGLKTLIDSIQDGTNSDYRWPTVVVIDYSDAETSEQEFMYTDTAKDLYESLGTLSVYVNVHVEGSNMKSDASETKIRLEEDVFVKYSDYEVCVKSEGIDSNDGSNNSNEWEHIEWEFARILARARLVPAVPGEVKPTTNTAYLTMGENTFFLSLSFPEITQVEPYVEEMCQDVDAMEYRTDLLSCRDSRFDLIYGMQLLRMYCRPHVVRVPAVPFLGSVIEDIMPIVYTVRTQNQAGTYPDDDDGISKMFELLDWGLRAGVEVLDVESAWDKEKTNALLSIAEERYSSQILGSHHVVGKEISTEEAVGLFQQCALGGRAHGAKVVLSIETEDKDRMAHEAAILASSLAEKDSKPVIPNISLILGDVGKFSRVVNLPYTPVTHESLPFKAAPGQMTANEILAARIIAKILRGRKYAILGHNIAYSVSPQMQGAGFAATRLPHQYGRADVETVEEFVESEFFNDPNFGGCSVTIPHKQAIIPYVDVLSDAAKTIGSVNTLIVEEVVGEQDFERVIHGDNTDWMGIFNPLERKLGGGNPDDDQEEGQQYCLILGGGGTARAAAYAASKLGLKRLYYNRTPSKAVELADAFGGTVLASLDETRDSSNESGNDGKILGEILSGNQGASIAVVISTLPAGAEFTLPEWLLSGQQETKPIIFDVNYKPYYTKLLRQAEASNCQVVRGSEMLWEQGVGQFEAWTKRSAPYAVMKAVVLDNCLPKEDEEAFQ